VNPNVARSRGGAEIVDAITERDLVVFEPREVKRFLDVSARNADRTLGEMVEK
jgi:hypothetical protein